MHTRQEQRRKNFCCYIITDYHKYPNLYRLQILFNVTNYLLDSKVTAIMPHLSEHVCLAIVDGYILVT